MPSGVGGRPRNARIERCASTPAGGDVPSLATSSSGSLALCCAAARDPSDAKTRVATRAAIVDLLYPEHAEKETASRTTLEERAAAIGIGEQSLDSAGKAAAAESIVMVRASDPSSENLFGAAS